MKYVQALISLGLFGFLGFALLDEETLADGGSGKARMLKSVANTASETIGVQNAAFALWAVGILMALFFMMRR